MDMSNKGGVPRTGRSAAEGVGVKGVQRREPRCKELQQLLEVEGTGVKEGVEGIKGKDKGRRKSGEVHNATSKSSMDKDRLREDRHP